MIATTSEDLLPDGNYSTVSRNYIEFLKILDNKYSEGDKIRIVLDNLKVHTSEETRKYPAPVPRKFEFVFTPKNGFWLNMAEGMGDGFKD